MLKVYRVSIVAALVTAMAGCHDASPALERGAAVQVDSPAQAAAETPAPPPVHTASAGKSDPRPVLVCFGDSLTAGLGMDAGQSYPDYLQANLDRLHYRYRVVNAGVSGNTTKDGVDRLDQVLAMHPAVAVVEFGGNDGLRGLPIAETRGNLDRIVTTLQSAGVKVVLAGITLPPDYGPDYIRQFDQTYTLIARKHRTPLLPFLLKGVYGQPGMMQRDEIHATAKGNQVVAKNVLPLVLPLLKR